MRLGGIWGGGGRGIYGEELGEGFVEGSLGGGTWSVLLGGLGGFGGAWGASWNVTCSRWCGVPLTPSRRIGLGGAGSAGGGSLLSRGARERYSSVLHSVTAVRRGAPDVTPCIPT